MGHDDGPYYGATLRTDLLAEALAIGMVSDTSGSLVSGPTLPANSHFGGVIGPSRTRPWGELERPPTAGGLFTHAGSPPSPAGWRSEKRELHNPSYDTPSQRWLHIGDNDSPSDSSQTAEQLLDHIFPFVLVVCLCALPLVIDPLDDFEAFE